MSEILKKRNNENDFEYGLRLMEHKVNGDVDLDWEDIVELLELGVHRDTIRKAMNVGTYSGYNIMQYYKQKIEEVKAQSTVQHESDFIDEIKQEKIELRKERIKLQDERRQYNSLIRTEARWEDLCEKLVNAIHELEPLTFTNKNMDINGNHASICLSDWHIGMEVDNRQNVFNTKIAQERVDDLLQQTITQCKKDNVHVLNVELCGDFVSGILHVTNRLVQQEDIVNQVMICSEMLSNFIGTLANEFPLIQVHTSVGNHGRITPSVKESLAEENFEYLIKWYLMARLEKSENVVFNTNEYDKEVSIYNIEDKVIAVAHGHREKKPFDSVTTLSNFLGIKIDEVHLGHFHNFQVSKGVYINGSLSGSDDYAQQLRYNNKPMQMLRIYYSNGSSCTHELILK